MHIFKSTLLVLILLSTAQADIFQQKNEGLCSDIAQSKVNEMDREYFWYSNSEKECLRLLPDFRYKSLTPETLTKTCGALNNDPVRAHDLLEKLYESPPMGFLVKRKQLNFIKNGVKKRTEKGMYEPLVLAHRNVYNEYSVNAQLSPGCFQFFDANNERKEEIANSKFWEGFIFCIFFPFLTGFIILGLYIGYNTHYED